MKKLQNVSPIELFEILKNSDYKGLASIQYTKDVDTKGLVKKVTTSNVRVGDEYSDKLKSREDKLGLENRTIQEANYISVGNIASIYKNDGAYSIRLAHLKNQQTSVFEYENELYTKQELIAKIGTSGILPKSFLEPKKIIDERFTENEDFSWNAVKMITIDNFTFNGTKYTIINKENDIKISELFKAFNKAKTAYKNAKTETTKQKHIATMDDIKKEINLLKKGANVDIINTRLEYEIA